MHKQIKSTDVHTDVHTLAHQLVLLQGDKQLHLTIRVSFMLRYVLGPELMEATEAWM